jgi:hypothetical protein
MPQHDWIDDFMSKYITEQIRDKGGFGGQKSYGVARLNNTTLKWDWTRGYWTSVESAREAARKSSEGNDFLWRVSCGQEPIALYKNGQEIPPLEQQQDTVPEAQSGNETPKHYIISAEDVTEIADRLLSISDNLSVPFDQRQEAMTALHILETGTREST